ncbi:MAG: hypothetical protein CL877_10065 [Dehalococcoidales bacterium]|nr:hypothetical protein [Dehalococcoidales bacterium]
MAVSYMSLFPNKEQTKISEDELWLRSLKRVFNGGGIFILQPMKNGEEVSYDEIANEEEIKINVLDGGLIRITFDGIHSIRISAEGCNLRFKHLSKSFEDNIKHHFTINQLTRDGHDVWRLIADHHSVFYIKKLSGYVIVDSSWYGQGSNNQCIEMQGEIERSEIIFSETEGGNVLHESSRIYDSCIKDLRNGFQGYCDQNNLVDHHQSLRLASYINWSSLVSEGGMFKRETMLMSNNWMNAVWSWDHCFNALAVRKSSPELAWNLFMSPFDHQDNCGALPDLISYTEIIKAYVKPPIHGWTFQKLWEASPEYYDTNKLKDVYEKLSSLTNYWMDYRDPYKMGIPLYYHGNDSGWDNSTCFKKNSPVSTPELAAYLVIQMNTLAEISNSLNMKTESTEWKEKSQVLKDKMFNVFFINGVWGAIYFSDEGNSSMYYTKSLLPYLVIVLGDKLPPEVISKIKSDFHGQGGFLTKNGLSTEALSSHYYESDGYWRGPIWAPAMYLIIDGLLSSGQKQFAKALANKFCNMCIQSGFYENFDAVTGNGLRDPAYTWTSSIFIELMNQVIFLDES